MGKFTDNLFKKNRTKPNREKHNVSNTSADEVGVLSPAVQTSKIPLRDWYLWPLSATVKSIKDLHLIQS